MEKEPNHEGMPFSETRESGVFRGASSKFHEVSADESKIIRESFVGKEKNSIEEIPEMTGSERTEYMLSRAKDFLALVQKYGIPIPKTEFVIGKNNKGEQSLFAVSDKIEGKSFLSKISPDLKGIEEIDSALSGIVRQMKDTYEALAPSWIDYSSSQMKYGRAPEDDREHPYLVDVDPYLLDWEKEYPDEKEREQIFWQLLHNVFSGIQSVEMSGDFYLRSARGEIRKIIEEYPEPRLSYARIKRKFILHALNS